MSTVLTWVKSSYSGSEGECLEIATPTPTTLHLRDSKSPGRTLTLTPATWTAFLRALPEMLAWSPVHYKTLAGGP
ncbi:DUF397 domain-containing protein [Streptomyces sp. NPDC006997]|uniref:DUF397 domain-containing protein n=1 Tax=Streptomyces sp. NPDC006997 TaxID=3155356 RepID=UPI0033EE70A4